MKKDEYKFQTVINKNTFYFYNSVFEEKYEAYINSLKETLLVIKNEVENRGCHKAIFEKLLSDRKDGLKILLALTGFSNEYLKRLITIARISDNRLFSKLLNKSKWQEKEDKINIKEWNDTKMQNLIINNEYFRKGIINLFFEGATLPFLCNTLPLFELKKLSISKLKFDTAALIDTLIRYKEKGSYSGKKENNPEYLLEALFIEGNISFEKGDLTDLLTNEFIQKRTMDFIIPNKDNPKIIVESSFLVTTSSGQGDKSKTETNINKLIKKYYPESMFVGFIDGIGWYVRQSDLRRMVTAYDDVFTFHKTELERFKKMLKKS